VNDGEPLRIGTRGSRLALWQARAVAELLEASGARTEVIVITTAGDRLEDARLPEVGGKGLFVREIEDALIRGDIDLAVHSAKDMPSELPDGLQIAATLPREDPRDALVLPRGSSAGNIADVLARLGGTPTIGTSSVRRLAQLATLLPRAAFTPIRGNVDTRLRKLDEGGYDALVLASAGLRRLGLGSRITSPLSVEHCVPAPGQGIIAVETRSDDDRTLVAVRTIHDPAAGVSLAAERALVTALGGGCQLPLGGVALHDGQRLEMHGIVAAPDGSRAARRIARGSASEPEALGRRLAAELARHGATEILDAVRLPQAESRAERRPT
jgi:hydroxymethylbilane synthase